MLLVSVKLQHKVVSGDLRRGLLINVSIRHKKTAPDGAALEHLADEHQVHCLTMKSTQY